MASNPTRQVQLRTRDQSAFMERAYNDQRLLKVVAAPVAAPTFRPDTRADEIFSSLQNALGGYAKMQESFRKENIRLGAAHGLRARMGEDEAGLGKLQSEDVYNKPLSFVNIGVGYDEGFYTETGRTKALQHVSSAIQTLNQSDAYKNIRKGALKDPTKEATNDNIYTSEEARAERHRMYEDLYQATIQSMLDTSNPIELAAAADKLQQLRTQLIDKEATDTIEITRAEMINDIATNTIAQANIDMNTVARQVGMEGIPQEQRMSVIDAVGNVFKNNAAKLAYGDNDFIALGIDASDEMSIDMVGGVALQLINNGRINEARRMAASLDEVAGSNDIRYKEMRGADGQLKFYKQITAVQNKINNMADEKVKEQQSLNEAGFAVRVQNSSTTGDFSAIQADMDEAVLAGTLQLSTYNTFSGLLRTIEKTGGGYSPYRNPTAYTNSLVYINSNRTTTQKLDYLNRNVGNLTSTDFGSLMNKIFVDEEKLRRAGAGDRQRTTQAINDYRKFVAKSAISGIADDSLMKRIGLAWVDTYGENAIASAITPYVNGIVISYADDYRRKFNIPTNESLFDSPDFTSSMQDVLSKEMINPLVRMLTSKINQANWEKESKSRGVAISVIVQENISNLMRRQLLNVDIESQEQE